MERTEIDVRRAVLSGLAAGIAYLAAAGADSELSSHSYNDLKLVGQMFTTKSPWWQIQGVAGHFGFAAVVALLYAWWGYRKIPGPPFLRGILFLQMENNLYAPGLLLDKWHAGVRSGQLPPMNNPKTFFGQVVRHVAFGFVLGLLYRPKSR